MNIFNSIIFSTNRLLNTLHSIASPHLPSVGFVSSRFDLQNSIVYSWRTINLWMCTNIGGTNLHSDPSFWVGGERYTSSLEDVPTGRVPDTLWAETTGTIISSWSNYYYNRYHFVSIDLDARKHYTPIPQFGMAILLRRPARLSRRGCDDRFDRFVSSRLRTC